MGIIGYCRSHDQAIALAKMLLDRIEHLGCGFDADHLCCARGPLCGWCGNECHFVAGFEGCAGKRITHPAAACVGDEAHRVDVFPSAARCY